MQINERNIIHNTTGMPASDIIALTALVLRSLEDMGFDVSRETWRAFTAGFEFVKQVPDEIIITVSTYVSRETEDEPIENLLRVTLPNHHDADAEAS